jgi:hypothetical protein
MEVARQPPAQSVDDRPTCGWCGVGRLDLIDERPHPLFGILGMTIETLKCDSPQCAKLTCI